MRKVLSVLLAVIMLAVCSVISYEAADEPRFQTEIVRGNIGEIVDVKLNIQNNPGITALSIDVAYSSDDLELISINNAALFQDAISTGNVSANPLRISWYAADSQNKVDNGTLAILRFRVRDNAICSRINISYNPENVFDKPFTDSYNNGALWKRAQGTAYWYMGSASGEVLKRLKRRPC